MSKGTQKSQQYRTMTCKSCVGLGDWIQSGIKNNHDLLFEIWKNKVSSKSSIPEIVENGKITQKGVWRLLASYIGLHPLSLLQLSIMYSHMQRMGFYVKDPKEFCSPHCMIPDRIEVNRKFWKLADKGYLIEIPDEQDLWKIPLGIMRSLSCIDSELTAMFLHHSTGCTQNHE